MKNSRDIINLKTRNGRYHFNQNCPIAIELYVPVPQRSTSTASVPSSSPLHAPATVLVRPFAYLGFCGKFLTESILNDLTRILIWSNSPQAFSHLQRFAIPPWCESENLSPFLPSPTRPQAHCCDWDSQRKLISLGWIWAVAWGGWTG
jgi:hypothetical protein